MKILLIDNHTKNLKEILYLLKAHDCTICTKELFESKVADLFDVVIILGGSKVRSVKNHQEDYINEIEFVKNTDKKIIGICLGCEIVAAAFKCELKENPLPHKGVYEIRFKNKYINVYESHRFQIGKVSDDIEILAESDFGIEIIKHKLKSIYGLQFHPEIEVGEDKNILMEIIDEM